MGSPAFPVICRLHSLVALACGGLMMFYRKETYAVVHGAAAAGKLLGSTTRDELLIRTSDSFAGLLLLGIGLILFMVSFVQDRDFQGFFAKGCAALHAAMALWRVYVERKIEDLAWDWLRESVGDVLLAVSWVMFVIYSWKDKYD